MALRLILVGVVASLALDLPHGDVRPVATRAIRSILVAEPASQAPDAGKSTLIAGEPRPAQANPPSTAEATIKPVKPVATIQPAVTIEPSLPVATPELVAAPPLSPLPAELALLPIASDAAPSSAPMPVPPVLEVASTPDTPTTATIPAPAPIPTTVAVAPMTPPSATVVESSPEAAPAPAATVVESETPAVAADPDAAFRKIVANMASSFAADLPASAPAADPKPLIAQVETPPVATPAPAPAPAEEVVAEAAGLDLYPGVAFALNRESEGITPIEAMARAEPAPAPVPVAEPSRADRLTEAVKLTGQALDAWAGLLSQRTPSSAVQR